MPSRLRPRRPGLHGLSDSSASPTDGRNSTPTSDSTAPTARAENGNVAVAGEIDLVSCDGTFVMALGFGPTAMEAGQHALITLLEDFDETEAEYIRAWRAWHERLSGRRPSEGTNRAVSHQCSGAADPRIEARRRRDHREPLDPVGILQARRRPGWLSPRLAARPCRDRRRVHRDRRTRARQTGAALPAGDAGARRPLVAEHVARRQTRTGMAFRWTKRPCRFCWSILRRAKA